MDFPRELRLAQLANVSCEIRKSLTTTNHTLAELTPQYWQFRCIHTSPGTTSAYESLWAELMTYRPVIHPYAFINRRNSHRTISCRSASVWLVVISDFVFSQLTLASWADLSSRGKSVLQRPIYLLSLNYMATCLPNRSVQCNWSRLVPC